MKQVLLAFLLLPSAPVAAQFIENPDLDTGGSVGWQGSCWDLAPGYGGGLALQFPPGVDWQQCCACTPVTGLLQEVTYQFSFWARRTGVYIFGMAHLMGFTPGVTPCPFSQEPQFGAIVPLSQLANEEWALLSTEFTIPSFVPADLNYFIVLLPSNTVDVDLSSALFDEFALTDLSTGLNVTTGPTLSLFPNPAVDKLWVDLPETPLSITAIDAGGRTHDLKNFTHRDQTLEVDVSTLPSGVNVLRITTRSASHILRSIKA